MTVMTHPYHLVRVEQAREEGYRAGEVYAQVSQELCTPDEWTQEKQDDWVDMLTWLGTCPYAVDQQPYTDATEAQNAYYAAQWQVAFKQGKHKTEAELRRAAA